MENEETNNVDNLLPVEDETYVDSTVDSLEIPEMTAEEADQNKEQENIEIENEGGV